MRCGLLGGKLGHSYSPFIHSHLGDYSYDLFEKAPEELADFLNIKPASMTDVLQRMEKNGLVARKRGENDLRTMHVTITEKGRNKSEEFLLKERSLDDLFFRGFDEVEKDVFLNLFARMTENLMSELDCLGVEE